MYNNVNLNLLVHPTTTPLSCLHFVALCPPHSLLVGDKQPTILKWRILSATNDLDRVSAVALPKLPISLTNTDLKVASDTQFYPGLGMVSQSPRGNGVGPELGLPSQGPGSLAPGLTSVPLGTRVLLSGSDGLKGL